jgi:hypothetical protein
LEVDGGAPFDWVETRFEARTDVPEELRRAAAETRRTFNDSSRPSSLEASTIALTLDDDNVPALPDLDAEKVGWMMTALVGNAQRFVPHGTRLRPGGTIEVHVTTLVTPMALKWGLSRPPAAAPVR